MNEHTALAAAMHNLGLTPVDTPWNEALEEAMARAADTRDDGPVVDDRRRQQQVDDYLTREKP